MNQFDQTTEKKAEEYADTHAFFSKELYGNIVADYTAARNSTKASLEILARAVEQFANYMDAPEFLKSGWQKYPNPRSAQNAIAQVKAKGDWPLEEK